MKIGLTFDLRTGHESPEVAPWAAEWDTPETIAALERALRSIGHEVIRIGNRDQLLARLPDLEADLVFNLAEGHSVPEREAEVPAILERHRIPYVGSGPRTLITALDKAATKSFWQRAGLPTPKWCQAPFRDISQEMVPGTFFPAIVKPRFGGSGMGIDPGAVVRDPQALTARCAWVIAHHRQPALIEEFIDGHEFTVCILGTGETAEALPPLQRPVDRVTGLGSYLLPGPRDADRDDRLLRPMDPPLERRLAETALVAHRLVGCRDMSRVDCRVDREGRVWLLEINPLPNLDPTGTVGILAEVMGLSYADLIGRILTSALARYPVIARAQSARSNPKNEIASLRSQ